ncbi:MAG: DUF4331 family protein, partial [Deltaproteobacteria bacterium]
ALAADHQDGPAVTNDPTADITDVFTWMPDANHVALVMDVNPAASTSSLFSNTVKYTFHTVTRSTLPALGGMSDAEIDVICTFDNAFPQNVSCWVGSSEYVTGNASATTGLSSADGKVKVFTGLRDDPFFFNIDGFKAVAADVIAAKSSLTFDAAGCPQLPAATATALATQLGEAPDGGAAVDHFLGLNVLAIVVTVDKSLLVTNPAHTAVGVWGSTNQ